MEEKALATTKDEKMQASLALVGHNIILDSGIMKMYGATAAMAISYFAYYTEYDLRYKKYNYNGRCWIRVSMEDLVKRYPGTTRSMFRTALAELERQGVVFVGNFNERPADKTKWYALNLELELLKAYQKCVSAKYIDKNNYRRKHQPATTHGENNQDHGENSQSHGQNNQRYVENSHNQSENNQAISNNSNDNNNIYNNASTNITLRGEKIRKTIWA